MNIIKASIKKLVQLTDVTFNTYTGIQNYLLGVNNNGTGIDALSPTQVRTMLNVEDGAEVNVQSDWNTTDVSHDSFIKNKPTNLSQFTNDISFAVKKNVTVTENFTNGALLSNNSNKTGEVLVGTDLEVVSGSLRVVRTYAIDIDFEYLTPFKKTAPFNMKINSIDKTKNPSMTVTITVNGSPYTLGTAINFKDNIVVTTSILGYLKLNCEKL